MKPETEFKWIINLLNGKFYKNLFSSNPGFKRQFEKQAGSYKNNTDFSKWFYKLVDKKIIVFHSLKYTTMSKPVKTYVINKRLLDKLLTHNILYKPSSRYILNNKILIG